MFILCWVRSSWIGFINVYLTVEINLVWRGNWLEYSRVFFARWTQSTRAYALEYSLILELTPTLCSAKGKCYKIEKKNESQKFIEELN